MLKQFNLDGEEIDEKTNQSFPFKGRCCQPCYNAKGKVCRCRCKGAFHAMGRKGLLNADFDKMLPEKEAKRFRESYDPAETKCDCGKDLAEEPIMYYVPHDGGWTIDCEEEKAWLFVHCPKCGYNMSIWKMGAPRE